MLYTCPECKAEDIGECEVCDNDCLTVICEKCDSEFCLDHEGDLVSGHDPNCGIYDDGDSDTEVLLDFENF